jgi:hypothetical protein
MTKIIEVNAETNEIIEREPTAAEIADFEQNQQNYNARIQVEAANTAARQAILDRLGLTQEEAALLLGAN